MAIFAVIFVLEKNAIRQGQAFNAALSADFMPRFVQPDCISVQVTESASIVKSVETTEVEITSAFTPIIDFEGKLDTYPDIVAWIQSEDTVINYPIVRGNDNEYYLSHLPDKSRNNMGSIFLDYRNSPDFSDNIILIYGHNMHSGDMFGSLRHYTGQLYFEKHPSMFIFTPTHNFTLLLFAAYVIDSTIEVPPMSFRDSEDFEQFIADIKNRSFFASDIEVNFGDNLMFLCTCTKSGASSERLVIVGKLLENNNESHI